MNRPNHTLNCLIVGSQTLPVQCGETLLAKGHRIVGIVTDDAQLRGWAEGRSIPVEHPDADPATIARGLQFDYLFSIVNGRILPQEPIERARAGAINFHDGPLPEKAGFNVTNWAILEGAKEHGITWHAMKSRLDAGDIFVQRRFPIAENETALTLNAKCYAAAVESFSELIDGLASGTIQPQAQDLSRRAYIPRYRRPAAGCLLDWKRPASELDALLRALDFGTYPNPMGLAKFWDGHSLVTVSRLTILDAKSLEAPGTIRAVGDGEFDVSTASYDVRIALVRRFDGRAWTPPGGLRILPELDAGVAAALTEAHSAAARNESAWLRRLIAAKPLDIGKDSPRAAAKTLASISLPQAPGMVTAVAGFLAYWVRSQRLTRFDVGFQDLRQGPSASRELLFESSVPLAVEARFDEPFAKFQERIASTIEELAKAGPFCSDLAARYPELRKAGGPIRYAVGVRLNSEDGADAAPMPGEVLTLAVTEDGRARLIYSEAAIGSEAELWAERFAAVIGAVAANGDATLASLPLMPDAEFRRVTSEWNRSGESYEDLCIHRFFERQAAVDPPRIAAVFEDSEISYGELNRRADSVAARLRSLGAGPGAIVGVAMERSLEALVSLMGVLKSGAAYLPLDPTLPDSRLIYMVEDSGARIVIASGDAAWAGGLPVTLVRPDRAGQEAVEARGERSGAEAAPADVAYVIYTSGSTGKPKGVAVTHRNVANFFRAMDEFNGPAPGVWLAVTSISFDISVYELFWTLARGFTVVMASERHRTLIDRTRDPRAGKPLDFSLFYFSSREDLCGAGGKYRLLLEGAKFADERGFHAIWTPERHFHEFGGLYPNPSVSSAAVAAVTKRVEIRAGSVVAPLHHPLRIAEEWSVVDNLSNGRAGISFASGWNARDFVLAPENYADAKGAMFRTIETVRELWRGGSVTLPDGKGNEASVTIRPLPVRRELPVWVTAAGNPETFRMAGERGFNILTHLLGQRIEDVAARIRIYREARRSAGHDPEAGRVTLMLHTYVAPTREEAREAVREPMKDYLRTSVDLIRNSPWSFPAFTNKPGAADLKTLDLSTLTPEEMDGLLEHAFERYFDTSGLFGSVEECVDIAERVRAIGVDEVACLIDFGVEADVALPALDLLDRVRRQIQAETGKDFSLPAQMEARGVTHLQTTPSMAKMLLASADSRAALGRLERYFVGGEALPPPLAAELGSAVSSGEVYNMYGPTETTIWSSVARVRGDDVTIGRPILNTAMYILDPEMNPVPAGMTGELFIGGDGLAQGYWGRPELTASRFPDNPFRPGERMYRTGDLARFRANGEIEFAGRIDQQIKLRGHRVELGEIEAALAKHPGIRDAAVVARELGGDLALFAYYTASGPVGDLRAWLKNDLPDYMVPAQFVAMADLPLTHNGKVDRKALPDPETAASSETSAEMESPESEIERTIAEVWREALHRTAVGVDENFFDAGGHSILAVQVNTKLRTALRREISLVDLFRFPTIRLLARHLGQGEASAGTQAIAESVERGRQRRDRLADIRARRRESSLEPAAVEETSVPHRQ